MIGLNPILDVLNRSLPREADFFEQVPIFLEHSPLLELGIWGFREFRQFVFHYILATSALITSEDKFFFLNGHSVTKVTNINHNKIYDIK